MKLQKVTIKYVTLQVREGSVNVLQFMTEEGIQTRKTLFKHIVTLLHDIVQPGNHFNYFAHIWSTNMVEIIGLISILNLQF